MPEYVKPKKHLGQHFLKDKSIAAHIVESLRPDPACPDVLEIGPGTGVLTQFLIQRPDLRLKVIEIDTESVAYLKNQMGLPAEQVAEGDFLEKNPDELFPGPFRIIGNFPYNISSQIFFKVLEFRERIPEVVGMVQKEVAERICARPGGKENGILSILLQAWYHAEYLFTVSPDVFLPPPKVQSAVIALRRRTTDLPESNPMLFFRVVKQAFSMRRKMLRNTLKPLAFPPEELADPFYQKRAEQLSVADFDRLAVKLADFLQQPGK